MDEKTYKEICQEIYTLLWSSPEDDLGLLNDDVNRAIDILKTVDIDIIDD